MVPVLDPLQVVGYSSLTMTNTETQTGTESGTQPEAAEAIKAAPSEPSSAPRRRTQKPWETCGPNVHRLDGIKLGNTETAKLALKLLHAAGAKNDLQGALKAVAERMCTSQWVIYYWIRGTREPKQITLRALQREVDRLDVSA